MKVNMTPNPLDVVTIHASQGDTEARQWEFELHNNGELIDTSDVKEQLVFKAYNGGTEQILPENGAVPVTAPFVGDIKYPDATRTDQEFLYRQSPAEEDGNAKITDIKGNTIVWNQLARPLTSDYYDVSNGTASYTDGVARYEITTVADQNYNNRITVKYSYYQTWVLNHKYLFIITHRENRTGFNLAFSITASSVGTSPSTSTNWVTSMAVVTNTAISGRNWYRIGLTGSRQVGDWFEVKNAMIIDLTQMGLDTLTYAEVLKWFADYFPLSYYSYNQGSLLSFNGTGIKTVGFNQWDEEWRPGNINVTTGEFEYTNDMFCSRNFIPVLPETDYFMMNPTPSTLKTRFYDAGMNYIGSNDYNGTGSIPVGGRVFKTPSNCFYFKFATQSGVNVYNNNICLNISNPARNGEYEPYTSSTLSLPISTYFPTGMKSAGNVYDELTETKAITRIGAIDLGSLTWTYANDAGHLRFVSSTISPNAKLPANNTIANAVCTKYGIVTEGNVYNNQKVGLCIISNSRAMVYDPNYTDATTFKSAMNGVYLYYELATESETSFTTASLVTENAEIPLSNEDGTLIGKCTEELSAEPGFHDAKIKLTDSDGTCYSNKIQLHVERSPQ